MDISRPADAAPAERMVRPPQKNQAGRPTSAKIERRKDRVLEVAKELFVSRGYSGTMLVDIAKGAGVATRTLSLHFGDKEAIFQDVIFARDTSKIIPAPTLQPHDTVHLALVRAARYACEVALHQNSIDLMRLMIAESNRFPELMRTVATKTFARFRRNVAKVFEALALEGLVPADADSSRSAELFVDLILGNTPILTCTNREAAPPTDGDIEERVNMFILGRFGTVIAKSSRTKKVRKVLAKDT